MTQTPDKTLRDEFATVWRCSDGKRFLTKRSAVLREAAMRVNHRLAAREEEGTDIKNGAWFVWEVIEDRNWGGEHVQKVFYNTWPDGTTKDDFADDIRAECKNIYIELQERLK